MMADRRPTSSSSPAFLVPAAAQNADMESSAGADHDDLNPPAVMIRGTRPPKVRVSVYCSHESLSFNRAQVPPLSLSLIKLLPSSGDLPASFRGGMRDVSAINALPSPPVVLPFCRP